VAQLSANNEALLDRLNEQMKSFQILQEASKNEFKNIAQQLLEEKSKSFATSQRKELNEVLTPLKERIQHFENKVDSSNKESIARHASLKEQIVGLSELNKQMTLEAQQLTNALNQDNKAQGNWGELILESILDKSGLEKGREYHLQESLVNDEGKTYRPDVIIDLPDGKKIIIDSKVSLKAYNKFVNPTPETDNKIALKAHCLSLRKHIEGLAAKNYHDLYRIGSPDFVMMFVPIETAFSAALSGQQDLYTYAFEKNIVIVTPSTLLATLKTVETLWRNDKQQRNAIGIATEAGKMYDKFASLVVDLQKIGQRIGQTQEAYNETMKKLQTGKGNLLTRAEKLKQMGAQANKTLPSRDQDGRRGE
jgi:DNA recombination protein RmuC